MKQFVLDLDLDLLVASSLVVLGEKEGGFSYPVLKCYRASTK